MASGDGVETSETPSGAVMSDQVRVSVDTEESRPFKAYFDFMADVDDDEDNCFDNDSALIRRMADEEVIIAREKQPKVLKNRYLVGPVLGDGAYAKVKECLDMTNNEVLAVKIIAMRSLRKMRGARQLVDQEGEIMAAVRHENVVRLIDDHYDERKDKRYFFLERCLGSVHDLQARGLQITAPVFRRLCEPQAHFYFRQLLAGVRYLHSQRVVHKDLKPGNLLLSADECIKITDFGVSERLDAGTEDDLITSDQGTPAILPPEVASGNATAFSGFKVDVYGAGVCLYFMLLGRVPYRDANVMRILQLIDEGRYDLPPEEVSPGAADLIHAMMRRDPDQRLSVDQVFANDWFVASQRRASNLETRSAFGWLDPHEFLVLEPVEGQSLVDAFRQLRLSDQQSSERQRGLNSLGIFDDEDEAATSEGRSGDEPPPSGSPGPSSPPPPPSPSIVSQRSRHRKRSSLKNCALS